MATSGDPYQPILSILKVKMSATDQTNQPIMANKQEENFAMLN